MKDKTIGFAITGSFCTFRKILTQVEALSKENTVIPILSYNAASTDTRFYEAAAFKSALTDITGNAPLMSIVDTEPIGPKKLLDILIIAPCTGNTLAKLANAITDTPVLMAAKAHMRNGRPVVVGVSTNDALSGSAKNIGILMTFRNIYFVPMSQDDCVKKERSIVADFDLVHQTADKALENKQFQPIYKA
ncbi:MAG: dipicolinate synthase subunit B [Clostridiales bacterium]|jgi:dipicolinate synthase subunit B|nr:dipicolinate synthase subunit B [Clostridiales bacterium]